MQCHALEAKEIFPAFHLILRGKLSESISLPVPLTLALLNLPKGKSLGRSKPATNS
jgi:hypothetical protein